MGRAGGRRECEGGAGWRRKREVFVGRGGGDADFSSSQFCFSTTDWQAFCGFALRSRAAESSFPIPGLETAKPPKMTSVGLTWLSVSRLSTCAEKGGGDGGRQAPKKVKDAVGALLLWLRRKTAEPAPVHHFNRTWRKNFYGISPLRTLHPGTCPLGGSSKYEERMCRTAHTSSNRICGSKEQLVPFFRAPMYL